MRQVVISRYGGPEVLEVRTAPDPEPGPGEIRIRVEAAGLNFADVSARMGLYRDAPRPPMTVGYEVAGTVDAVGPDTDDLAAGDRVLAVTRFGGQSEAVVVPRHQAVPVPGGKDIVAAAALPVTYLTAYLMVCRLGNVRRGESVLIHAVAGGVGLSALQLARDRGAVTFGTARAGKHGRLRDLGLDHAIDYRTVDFAAEVRRLTDGRGVDVILDAVGGATTRRNYRLLAPMGRLFLFGMSAASQGNRRNPVAVARTVLQTPFLHPLGLMDSNKGVFGVNLGHLWDETGLIGPTLTELTAMWQDGRIDPVVDCVAPFADAARAHRRLSEAENFGKVVLVP